jgi:hypothetical protein
MTKRRLTPAQKNLLEWGIAWSAVLILILTCAGFIHLCYLNTAWWSRALFIMLLLVEVGLYLLWGMIGAGRVAPRTILVFLCKPIRQLAFLLLRLTMPYAPEEEAFTLFVCVLPVEPESAESYNK